MSNPLDMLKGIGAMVWGRADFAISDVCHQPNDDYWIIINKERDITVLTVLDGYGVHLDVKASVHFEDSFVLYPILFNLDTLVADCVLRTAIKMLEDKFVNGG